MSNTWTLTEARAKLSEVIRRARRKPQIITVRGVPKVEFISIGEYLRRDGRVSDFDDEAARSPKAKPRVRKTAVTKNWTLQDAKKQLGKLLDVAAGNPQAITLDGLPEIVVLAPGGGPKIAAGEVRAPMSLYEVLRSCPHELKIPKRRRERPRPVDL